MWYYDLSRKLSNSRTDHCSRPFLVAVSKPSNFHGQEPVSLGLFLAMRLVLMGVEIGHAYKYIFYINFNNPLTMLLKVFRCQISIYKMHAYTETIDWFLIKVVKFSIQNYNISCLYKVVLVLVFFPINFNSFHHRFFGTVQVT